jgi:hypothetical protein
MASCAPRILFPSISLQNACVSSKRLPHSGSCRFLPSSSQNRPAAPVLQRSTHPYVWPSRCRARWRTSAHALQPRQQAHPIADVSNSEIAWLIALFKFNEPYPDGYPEEQRTFVPTVTHAFRAIRCAAAMNTLAKVNRHWDLASVYTFSTLIPVLISARASWPVSSLGHDRPKRLSKPESPRVATTARISFSCLVRPRGLLYRITDTLPPLSVLQHPSHPSPTKRPAPQKLVDWHSLPLQIPPYQWSVRLLRQG